MTNKTARYTFAALAGAALLLGCSRIEKEALEPANLTARIAEELPATRTSYDGYEGKFLWNEGDEIAVHLADGTANGRYETFKVLPNNPAETASVPISTTSTMTRNAYAVYPASAVVASAYGSPTLKVSLPAEYDISDIVSGASSIKTSDFSPCPMVAINDPASAPDQLDFYHVGGLLRITLKGVEPTTRKVRVTFDEYATGTFAVATPSAVPSASVEGPKITAPDANSRGKVVTFTLAETSLGATLAAGNIVLNVPVPCVTFNSVTVETLNAAGESEATKTFDEKPLVFNRHHGKKLAFGELALDLSMEPISDILITGRPVMSDHAEDVSVTVDKFSSGVWVSNAPWKAYFTDTEPSVGDRLSSSWSETPLKDAVGNDWLTLSAYEGDGDANDVTVSLVGSPFTTPRARNWKINAARIRDELRSGSGVSNVDLSVYDILDGSTSGDCETANCYVIKSYGSYLIPCVYGNAYSNGAPNPGSYQTSVTGEVTGGSYVYTVLNNFINSDGNAIGDPVITRDPNLTVSSQLKARVVWQDVLPGCEIITDDDLEYVPTNGTAANCPYIRVNFQKDKIASGNIVVALYDELNEKILWSWHLWVTTDTLETIGVMQNDDVTVNQFLNVPIGWTPPIGYTGGATSERSQYVVIVSKTNGVALGSFHVSQAEYDERTDSRMSIYFRYLGDEYADEHAYAATTYVWGRKDPFVPSYGNQNIHRPLSFPSDFPATVRGSSDTGSPTRDNLPAAELNSDAVTLYQTWIRMPYSHMFSNKGILSINLWDADANDYHDSPVIKTVYDPSPRGFHVPNVEAFNGFFDVETEDFNHLIIDGSLNLPKASHHSDHELPYSQWKDNGVYVSYNGWDRMGGNYSDYIGIKKEEISRYFACTTNHSSDENSFNFILYRDWGADFYTNEYNRFDFNSWWAEYLFASYNETRGPVFDFVDSFVNGRCWFDFGYESHSQGYSGLIYPVQSTPPATPDVSAGGMGSHQYDMGSSTWQ